MIKYACNSCPDTEDMYDPCIFELSSLDSSELPPYCPLTGEECEWVVIKDSDNTSTNKGVDNG